MGNYDRNSVVKHVFYGLLTRYLRFLPQTHQGWVCMRTVMIVKQTFGLVSKGFNLQKPRATYTSQNGVFTERVR